jgi:ASC-1-like (ASCH) protein
MGFAQEGFLRADTHRLVCRVQRCTKYKTFEAMLKKESVQNVLPGVKSVKEGVKIYREFYDADTEKEWGVVAIRLHSVVSIRVYA